jgi:hypothetical protein
VSLGLLGSFLGLFHYSRWRGVLCGAPLGGVLGLLLGPLIYVPPASFPEVVLTALGGSLVIVGVGALARWTGASPKTDSGAGSPFQKLEHNDVVSERRQLSDDEHSPREEAL